MESLETFTEWVDSKTMKPDFGVQCQKNDLKKEYCTLYVQFSQGFLLIFTCIEPIVDLKYSLSLSFTVEQPHIPIMSIFFSSFECGISSALSVFCIILRFISILQLMFILHK